MMLGYVDINVKMLNVKVANGWLVELCLYVCMSGAGAALLTGGCRNSLA